jgi:hypothetical protein
MLRIKKGWVVGKNGNFQSNSDWIFKENESWEYAYVLLVNNKVFAYPHGLDSYPDNFDFNLIEEAHAFLLNVGSESPWEEQ